jgi:TolB-like protein/tetratricopeptide (TPR) repeat protein
MSLWAELKRRNVIRVAVFYAVAAWLVLQVADVLFGILGVPDWSLRLVLGMLILGVPFVLVFSWAYELTPEGIKREKDVDRTASITTETGHKLNTATLVVAVLAIVVVVADRLVPETAPPPAEPAAPAEAPDPVEQVPAAAPDIDTAPVAELVNRGERRTSIAVLPFVNMSRDPDNEYFSDGISEEILNFLAKSEDLRVASRTSAFFFKDKDVDIPTIAAKLNVDHVLEGSVRRAGDRVRITAQLIEVETDSHLWSETYDREIADVFSVQEEIAGQIVDALKVTLARGEVIEGAEGTNDLVAYDLFLRGRHLWHQRTEEGILRAIELARQAVERDPQFARAWELLAAALDVAPWYTEMTWQEALPPAGEAARRAIELDPGRAIAWGVRADVEGFLVKDFAMGEKHFRQGLAADPSNTTMQMWGADYLRAMGYLAEAHVLVEAAYEADPLYPPVPGVLAYSRLAAGDLQGAREVGRAAADLGSPAGYGALASIGFLEGDSATMIDSLRRTYGVKSSGPIDKVIAALEARDGRERAIADLLGEVDRMMANGQSYDACTYVLPAIALLGNSARLGDRLVACGRESFQYLFGAIWTPELSDWRRSDSFEEYVRVTKLLDYWEVRGWPDLCRPDGDGIACE